MRRFLLETTSRFGAAALLAALALFSSASAQPFTFTALRVDLPRLDYGSAWFADLDDDGYLDALYTGNSNSQRPFSGASGVALSRYDPSSPLALVPFDKQPLAAPLWLGQAAFADWDLDGDPDFVLTGTEAPEGPYPSETRLYRNDGQAVFSIVDAGMTGVHSGVTRWSDYDNDGDPDLLLLGRTSDGTHAVILYRNDGAGSFSEVDTPFPGLAFGDAAWADIDGDGDNDVVISGTTADGRFTTRLYTNSAEGSFAVSPQSLANLAFSSLAWGDYDADGDPDLVISGAELGIRDAFVGKMVLYSNEDGQLIDTGQEFFGVFYGHVSWGDFDLDGDLDLFSMGRTSMLGNHVGYIYRNEDGHFRIATGLVGTSTSNAHWGDFDGDNDVDILVSGLNLSAIPFSKIYRNDSRLLNSPPLAPEGLAASVGAGTATLSWAATSDVETPAAGLTYNLRIGTAPGGSDVMSTMSSVDSGRLRVPAFGNVGGSASWTIRDLPVGLYYWSVQAVDNSFIGSPFAPEAQFTVTTGGKFPTSADDTQDLPSDLRLLPVYPNPVKGSATFSFDLPRTTSVRLEVYDVLGQRIRTVSAGLRRAGRHVVNWDGTTEAGVGVVAGVYFVRLRAGNAARSRQMVVWP